MIGKNMDKNVVLVALFAAVIAALGLIPKITLISGVPITAQSPFAQQRKACGCCRLNPRNLCTHLQL